MTTFRENEEVANQLFQGYFEAEPTIISMEFLGMACGKNLALGGPVPCATTFYHIQE